MLFELTFLLVHVLLHALRARAALREEGLVVVRGRELRRARAHLAQQLDAARAYLVLAFRYYLTIQNNTSSRT